MTTKEQEELYQIIGFRIFKARREKRLSEVDLAKLMGMSRSSIVNMEKGRHKLHVYRLIEIGKILDKPINYFLPQRKPVHLAIEKAIQDLKNSNF